MATQSHQAEAIGQQAQSNIVRLRRSQFISDYVKTQQTEEDKIRGVLDELAPPAQAAA